MVFKDQNIKNLIANIFVMQPPNGLRYLRWGGDGEAVQPEKCSGVGNRLKMAQNPTRQVLACKRNSTGLLSGTFLDTL